MRWRWGAAGDDGEIREDGVLWGLAVLPAHQKRHWSPPQATVLGERAGDEEERPVGGEVWQDAPVTSWSSQEKYHGLLFPLPMAGEVMAGNASCLSDWRSIKNTGGRIIAWKKGPELVASGVLCSY